MEIKQNSPENYKCEYCNNEISILTKKLQQHHTSNLWMKHGQCCAACVAPKDITGLDRDSLQQYINYDSHEIGKSLPGNHYTNIARGLERASVIEEQHEIKIKKLAQRYIAAGKIIAISCLAAAFIFFYYELFTLALASSAFCIAGIFLGKLGVCKKCRTR